MQAVVLEWNWTIFPLHIISVVDVFFPNFPLHIPFEADRLENAVNFLSLKRKLIKSVLTLLAIIQNSLCRLLLCGSRDVEGAFNTLLCISIDLKCAKYKYIHIYKKKKWTNKWNKNEITWKKCRAASFGTRSMLWAFQTVRFYVSVDQCLFGHG